MSAVRNIICLIVILLDLANSIGGGVLHELGESSPKKKTSSVLNDAKRHFVIAKMPISSMILTNQLGKM